MAIAGTEWKECEPNAEDNKIRTNEYRAKRNIYKSLVDSNAEYSVAIYNIQGFVT